MTLDNGTSANRKQGTINKCPNCGGVLKAFSSSCELCGHELSGVAANKTISDLVEKFEAIEAELSRSGLQGSAREKEIVTRKGRIIRDFAIPNSRDDLQSLIFFIHPKIQNNIKPDPNAEDWRVKFKEVMTLAKNAYRGDAKIRTEFEEIERSLNTSLSDSLQTHAKRSPLIVSSVVVLIALAAGGLGMTHYEKWTQTQCEQRFAEGINTETNRLNAIVAAIDAKKGEKLYAEASSLLNNLKWNYQEDCKQSEAQEKIAFWEQKRQALLAAIQQSEAADLAIKQEATRQEQAQKQEILDKEMAEKRAIADREAALKRNQRDRELEDSLSSRAKAAAARQNR